MDRIGLRKLARVGAVAALLAMLLVNGASAQGRIRPPCHGEPSDPDGAYLPLQEAHVDLSDYGLNAMPPQGEAEATSWFEALLNLLRTAGLLPPKDAG